MTGCLRSDRKAKCSCSWCSALGLHWPQRRHGQEFQRIEQTRHRHRCRPIESLDGWFEHAPPEGGERQWVDGHSAKEQAKAWLRRGQAEDARLRSNTPSACQGSPTLKPGRPTRSIGHGSTTLEGADGANAITTSCWRLVSPVDPMQLWESKRRPAKVMTAPLETRAVTPPPSDLPGRCNLLARALFGRPVCDADGREIIDDELAEHGYQLWTGAVGTVREAQARGLSDAALSHPPIRPRSAGPGYRRSTPLA